MDFAKIDDRTKRGKFILFILGEVFAFGFICLMQFIDVRTQFLTFVLVLIGMHGGIILLLLSKKLFTTEYDDNLKKYYSVEYILLALYLPVLLLKILGVTFSYPTKLVVIFSITAVAVIISIINNVRLYKELFDRHV